jgi:hypothetical protein
MCVRSREPHHCSLGSFPDLRPPTTPEGADVPLLRHLLAGSTPVYAGVVWRAEQASWPNPSDLMRDRWRSNQLLLPQDLTWRGTHLQGELPLA